MDTLYNARPPVEGRVLLSEEASEQLHCGRLGLSTGSHAAPLPGDGGHEFRREPV